MRPNVVIIFYLWLVIVKYNSSMHLHRKHNRGTTDIRLKRPTLWQNFMESWTCKLRKKKRKHLGEFLIVHSSWDTCFIMWKWASSNRDKDSRKSVVIFTWTVCEIKSHFTHMTSLTKYRSSATVSSFHNDFYFRQNCNENLTTIYLIVTTSGAII